MTGEELFESLNGIGDDLLVRSEEAAGAHAARKRRLPKGLPLTLAAAACLGLSVLGYQAVRSARMNESASSTAGSMASYAANSAAVAEEAAEMDEAAETGAAEDAIDGGADSSPAEAAAGEMDDAGQLAAQESAATTENAAMDSADTDEYAVTESAREDSDETAPLTEEYAADSEAASDEDAYIYYNGRRYVFHGYEYDAYQSMGERIGTIDSSGTKDTALSGSMDGDVYELKGYSLDERLCMEYDDPEGIGVTLIVFRAE